ncbi:MAG: hypothetical protein JSR36_05965 [Proteobacteria bacterium]|nr:hypothetical protein [Pseudomonadota bacterium]
MTSPALHPAATMEEAAPRGHAVVGRFLLHVACLIGAAIAFVAYQHLKLHGLNPQATVALVVAGLLAFSPVRALLGEFFALEGKVLHMVHGIGGLALVGLGAGGVISGNSLLNHAAMAPFAIMGAAQALMHQDHPRNAQQAAALRNFATSLPEVAQFTQGSLADPANAKRAVTVLSDLIGKAEVLGETELKADPKFQSAWAQATTRTGLTLGLDSIDKAVDRLAKNPETAPAVPELKRRLAQARRIAAADR